MNDFIFNETQEGLTVTAFNETVFIPAEKIMVMTWNAAVRRASVHVAVVYVVSGKKVHCGLATFEHAEGGDWEFAFVQCKNGGRVKAIGFWESYAADKSKQAKISKHGGEKCMMPALAAEQPAAPQLFRGKVFIFKTSRARMKASYAMNGGALELTRADAEAKLKELAARYPKHKVEIDLRAPGLPEPITLSL